MGSRLRQGFPRGSFLGPVFGGRQKSFFDHCCLPAACGVFREARAQHLHHRASRKTDYPLTSQVETFQPMF
jgi:hypothetical protein